jgi:hypothetical protein
MLMTSLPAVTARMRSSSSSSAMNCGLTDTTTTSARSHAAALSSVTSTP